MIKEILKDGDLILFHTKGFSFISIGIRLLTESFWNHVGMYVIDIDKQGFVIEALGKGVAKTSIDKYIDNKNYILKIIALKEEAFEDKEEYEKGLQLAISRMRLSVGQKYDWTSIMWLGIKYIIKGYWNKGAKYIPEKYNLFNSRNKVFCSELICEVFKKTSSKVENLFVGKKYPNATCSTITPKDIAKSKWVKFIAGIDKI